MTSGWTSESAPYITPRQEGAPDAWTEEAAQHGARGTNCLTFTGELTAPPFVAGAFGIATGCRVVARCRLVSLDGTPVEIATSYYPAHIAAGTALGQPKKIKGGAITLLSTLGYITSEVTEYVDAEIPEAEVRQQLRMSPHEPVITINRINVDQRGTAFQAEIMTAPAGKRRLRYKMKVDS